jgi:hypothetical protein
MCCGHPNPKPKRPVDTMPPNPRVKGGTRLLYLGSGPLTIRGTESGLQFHVAEYRRDFLVPAEDVAAILKRKHVILAP